MTAAVTRVLRHGKKAVSVVRLKPFDTTTETGRSNERYRRMALTSLASVAAKGITMTALLISVPLTLHYLGVERYGLWMTMTSFIAMLIFADFGIGNGLMTTVSIACGREDRLAAQRSVSSGFFLLSGIGFTLALIFGLSYPFIPWGKVFNISSAQAIQEAGPAVIVLMACFALNLPLGIVIRTQTGFQEGFQSNLWQCGSSAAGLLCIFLAIRLHAGLPWLVLAAEGTQIIATLLNGIVFFRIQHRWLSPSPVFWSRQEAQELFQTGLLFFIWQVALIFAITSDNLIAAHVIGSRSVAQYSVVARLFSVITVLANMVITPMWPAYGEAFARGDMSWVKSVLRRTLKMSLVCTFFPSLLLVMAGPSIIHVWIGNSITVPLFLVIGFGVWCVLNNLGSTMSIFLNGVRIIRFQAICAIIFAVFGLGAKIVLAREWGITGIIWGLILAYILSILLPFSLFVNRFLHQDELTPEKPPLK